MLTQELIVRNAYHEAGHAVYLHGIGVGIARIVIEEQMAYTDPKGSLMSAPGQKTEMLFCGGFAQERGTGITPLDYHLAEDHRQIEELLDELAKDVRRTREEWRHFAKDRARRFVGMYWLAIEALAQAIIATPSKSHIITMPGDVASGVVEPIVRPIINALVQQQKDSAAAEKPDEGNK